MKSINKRLEKVHGFQSTDQTKPDTESQAETSTSAPITFDSLPKTIVPTSTIDVYQNLKRIKTHKPVAVSIFLDWSWLFT